MLLLAGLGLAACLQSGCNMVPRYHLQQAQYRTRQLYEQNKALMAERNGLMQQNSDLLARGNLLQQRLDNLKGDRDRLASMKGSNPMSESTSRQFEDLARRYPGFEFDPQTGVSKFQNEILFNSGSDELRAEASPLLAEFARIMNSGDAQELQILIAGHTDDQRVAKPATKAKHPDNWYLSAHRAISVVHSLKQNGMKESRMGVAGYGPHQPRIAETSDTARRQNRRVEIFVLAPGASMAGRDVDSFRK
jgi:chemotaxis protein MotB